MVFSGIFPPGDRFFTESVRNFRDRITAPVLKPQVSGVVGQEALHGREHVFIALLVVASWIHLMAKEGQLLSFHENGRGLKALLGRGGLLSAVLRHMPTHRRHRFHPSQQVTQDLEHNWRARLFGPEGDLVDVYRNPQRAPAPRCEATSLTGSYPARRSALSEPAITAESDEVLNRSGPCLGS